MNELALQQQGTVDRIALVGTAIATALAIAFVLLDPIQTVARSAAPATLPERPEPVAPPAVTAPSPLVQLPLPSPAWTVVSDGSWAVYTRVEPGAAPALVARSLHSDESRLLYRAGATSYMGQLSLGKGVLAFEEIAQPNGDAQGRTIAVRAVSVPGGAVNTIDSFPATRSFAASPLTDGTRVLWVRPATAGGDEIRSLDLASGSVTTLLRRDDRIAGLALAGGRLAFTAFAGDAGKSYVFDLASARLTPVEGFAYSYVQSIGPAGVIVTAAAAPDAPAASWLVRTDGTRTRLASDCFSITMTARLAAMRCATQIEIRDLATASSLYHFAGNAGALAVFDDGVVWGEGDALMLYELAPVAGTPARAG